MLILFGFYSVSAASTVNFGDSVKYWETWGNDDFDGIDANGTPQLHDWDLNPNSYAEVENGILKEVAIAYTLTDDYQSNAGDLFINIQHQAGDNYWDHVLTTEKKIYSFADGTFSALDIPNSSSNAFYLFSDDVNPGGHRPDHPVALDADGLTESGSFTTFMDFKEYQKKHGDNLGFVLFSGFDIDLGGQDFIIGFGADCANDVIYETVNNPVPLPPAVLLFGSGLIGLIGLHRKKKI